MIGVMARKLRIEGSEGLYHVINRGNYRSWIFETAGARAAFEATLGQSCGSQKRQKVGEMEAGNRSQHETGDLSNKSMVERALVHGSSERDQQRLRQIRARGSKQMQVRQTTAES